MKTKEILAWIEKEGGFINWQRWNKKQIAEWVQVYFDCSKYVANRVSLYL